MSTGTGDGGPGRRLLGWPLLVVAVAVAVAAATPWLADRREPSLGDRTQSIASGLRCPTCVAETVADSSSPIARGMREEIREQVAAGRSRGEIVDWFRARYGDQVVLAPPADGIGWALWLVPGTVLVGGVALVVAGQRARGRTAPGTTEDAVDGPAGGGALPGGRLVATGALVVLVAAAVPLAVSASSGSSGSSGSSAGDADEPPAGAVVEPTSTEAWVAVARDLDDAGEYADAVRAWREAHRLQPGSARISTRLAFALLREGRAAQAERTAREPAGEPGAYRTLALLVLGLAQREQGDPAATGTLREFLDRAPEHPAAAEVRRLLGR